MLAFLAARNAFRSILYSLSLTLLLVLDSRVFVCALCHSSHIKAIQSWSAGLEGQLSYSGAASKIDRSAPRRLKKELQKKGQIHRPLHRVMCSLLFLVGHVVRCKAIHCRSTIQACIRMCLDLDKASFRRYVAVVPRALRLKPSTVCVCGCFFWWLWPICVVLCLRVRAVDRFELTFFQNAFGALRPTQKHSLACERQGHVSAFEPDQSI